MSNSTYSWINGADLGDVDNNIHLKIGLNPSFWQ